MDFIKATYNQDSVSESDYRKLFTDLGFNPSRIEINLVNGLSVYVTLNVRVLNENKMYADVFVYNSLATLTVRISNHDSNLEKICGGVSRNKLSFKAFNRLVENGIIEDNK